MPKTLELGPIVARFIPYYVFSAKIESVCSGQYDIHDGPGIGPTQTELRTVDELNEILVCSTTDVHPLIDELFQAKAFLPPPPYGQTPHQAAIPVPPKHPFHAIRFRDHLFSPSLIEDAIISDADIPADLATEMICDYLTHVAGPFLAIQDFKTRYGSDARELSASTSIKSLIRHFLLLPIYTTTYSYRDHTYNIFVSGVNGHVVGQRMTWGTGPLGKAVVSVGSSLSKLVSNNI